MSTIKEQNGNIEDTGQVTFAGSVRRIIYEKEAFAVATFSVDYRQHPQLKPLARMFLSEEIKVSGYFTPALELDAVWEITGVPEKGKYGWQIKASATARQWEMAQSAIRNYLASSAFPGVGQIAALKVCQALGDDALTKIIADPAVLDAVPIDAKKKQTIIEKLRENHANDLVLLQLIGLGLTAARAQAIYTVYKAEAYEKICANPYSLIGQVPYYSFNLADEIGKRLAIGPTDPRRLKAAIVYLLNRMIAKENNTKLARAEFLAQLDAALHSEVDRETIGDLLQRLVEEKAIYLDADQITAYKYYAAENAIAQRLALAAEQRITEPEAALAAALAAVQKTTTLTYSPSQLAAIKNALAHNVSLITGGPGTGKSTVIKGVIDAHEALWGAFGAGELALVAPTGRAAKRMDELTGCSGQTIHKLLGFIGDNHYLKYPGDLDDLRLVIIDEASMLDVELASRLFRTLDSRTKLVIVGDADQLPSVAPGNLLHDLIASNYFPVTRLASSFRQEEGSAIVALAAAINAGTVTPADFTGEVTFIEASEEAIIPLVLAELQKLTAEGGNLQKDLQVLAPMYKKAIGIDRLNAEIQDTLNSDNAPLYKTPGVTYRLEDKILQTVNRPEKNIMNGDIGVLTGALTEDGKISGLTARFDQTEVSYTLSELDDITLAYAISIHKAQGSEFDCVILPVGRSYYWMLQKQLLYTAITRAKRRLIIIGERAAFFSGVSRIAPERATNLGERLRYYFEAQPALPELKISDFL